MDRFDTMLAFTRVVELKSFTKAAASLNLPKATVSAQVIALEKRLRVKLLQRTTRHVSVTPDGTGYYERAVRLLSELEETEASLHQTVMRPKGRLRIDVPGSLGRLLIAPALGDFFGRYPEIELEMGCTDRHVDLIHEGIDCVIRGGNVQDEMLVARKLTDIRLVTCAAPSYLAKHGIPATPADLAGHIAINFAAPMDGGIRPFAYEQAENIFCPKMARCVSIDDADTCAAAACSGIGLVQLPAYIVNEYVRQGSLQIVLEDQLSERIPLTLLYPQNRHLSGKVRAFSDWASTLFAGAAL